MFLPWIKATIVAVENETACQTRSPITLRAGVGRGKGGENIKQLRPV